MEKVELNRIEWNKLSKEDKNNISEILDKSNSATVFHSLEWNEAIDKVFSINRDVIIAKCAEEETGFYSLYRTKKYNLINAYKSPDPSLESVYGGPIAINGFENVIGPMIKESERIAKGAILSIQTPPGYDIRPFQERTYNTVAYQTLLVNLQKKEDELWKGIDRKARNLVRKAENSNLIVTEGYESDIDDYYELIKRTYARSGNLHLLPVEFYKSIMRILGPKSMVRMRIVKHEHRFIAGAIFLCYKGTVYYWSGASSDEHKNLAPNNLIQWDILKWARDQKYSYYDLLRIEPDRLPGIAKFKMGWGGRTVDFYYAFKITGFVKELYGIKSTLGEYRISWRSLNQS